MNDLISINQLSKEQILALIGRAGEIKKNAPGPILNGKIMASCFFEPSTRTRLSFEAAMKRLGGDVIGFSDTGSTSSGQKGESLEDAMRVIGLYADVLVIRHPVAGSAKRAADASETPVVNAGDGTNEHPSQTLLDLFTMQESCGKLEGLRVALVGDLLHGRTVHSLARALSHFGARLYFVAPSSLQMPQPDYEVECSYHETIEEVLDHVDVLYMTRIQKERFADSQQIEENFVLKPESIPADVKVMHPLPRVSEIPPECDALPQAVYFNQAENGVYMRQAILCEVFGV